MDSDIQVTVYLFFLANLLYCFAYLIRDILWLRVVTVIGALCTFPYFIFQAQVLYLPLFWQCAFAVINAANIAYLLWERKPVRMSESQRRLHSLVFRDFSSRDVVRLLSVADWCEAEVDELLIQQDRRIDKLYLVYSGLLMARVDGEFRRHIRDGEFVGELSYILQQTTTADVVAVHPTRYLSWDRQVLEAHLGRHPGVKAAFKNLLSYDVAGKLAWPNKNANMAEATG